MSDPIPILFTIPNFITAGSGRALLNIIERIDRKIFFPAVCVFKKGGDLDREVEKMGLPFIEAPFTVSAKPYTSLFSRAWKISKIFRPYQFRLWHSFHYLDDYTEALIARFAGAKWIYTKKNMNWGGRAWHLRSILASRIVAQNAAMKNGFLLPYKSKTCLIPRGVDTDRFKLFETSKKMLKKNLGLQENAVIALHVGHFVPVKNHSLLLRALAKAKKNISLVCAGEFQDKKYADEIQALIADLGLKERIFLLGKREDIPQLLQAADIFVFASLRESSPVAVIEAMASGLPAVVTDIPAMRDLHIENGTALFSPSDDPATFAASLDQLAEDENKRVSMGLCGRKRVEEKFSINRETAEHERVYLKLLGSKKKGT